jgi:peptide/nickel transport system substrate-binding protein
MQVEPEILRAMEAAGQGKIVTGFGSAVERLIVNLTNPDPNLGDDRSVWMDNDGDGVNDNPHPFLADYNVRRALSLAIDRNVIVQVGYGQAGMPGCNILPAPAIYVSTANDECLVQDVAQANQLLDDAGWVRGADGVRAKDGVRLSILYQTSTNSVRQGTQALVKQMWEAIGVETELRNISADVFFGGDPASPDTYGKFYADIEMYTNTFDGTDPEAYLGNWVCGEVSGPDNQWLGNNIPRWCENGNAEYQALIDELALTVDINARAEIAKQLNDMLMQDYAMIPLVTRGDVSAVHNTLLGVRFNVWDSELWNIADWSRASE